MPASLGLPTLSTMELPIQRLIRHVLSTPTSRECLRKPPLTHSAHLLPTPHPHPTPAALLCLGHTSGIKSNPITPLVRPSSFPGTTDLPLVYLRSQGLSSAQHPRDPWKPSPELKPSGRPPGGPRTLQDLPGYSRIPRTPEAPSTLQDPKNAGRPLTRPPDLRPPLRTARSPPPARPAALLFPSVQASPALAPPSARTACPTFPVSTRSLLSVVSPQAHL